MATKLIKGSGRMIFFMDLAASLGSEKGRVILVLLKLDRKMVLVFIIGLMELNIRGAGATMLFQVMAHILPAMEGDTGVSGRTRCYMVSAVTLGLEVAIILESIVLIRSMDLVCLLGRMEGQPKATGSMVIGPSQCNRPRPVSPAPKILPTNMTLFQNWADYQLSRFLLKTEKFKMSDLKGFLFGAFQIFVLVVHRACMHW